MHDPFDRLRTLLATLAAPPAAGWATSRSGYAPLARDHHEEVFGSTDASAVRSAWLRSLAALDRARVVVVGVPYDGGSFGLAGAASGPTGIRCSNRYRLGASSPGTEVLDIGDVRYFPGPPLDSMLSDEVLGSARAARFAATTRVEPLPVCVLSAHREIVRLARRAGLAVISLGGDHSISATGVLGLGRPVGLVHLDGHPDLSEGRDGLELLHSSWLNFADRRQPFGHVVQYLLDPGTPPRRLVDRISQFDARSIVSEPDRSARACADLLAATGVSDVYFSIDIDVVRSSEAPATGLPAHDGVPASSVALFARELTRHVRVVGADVVEVSPALAGHTSWRDEPTCATAAGLVHAMADRMRSEPRDLNSGRPPPSAERCE